MLTRGVVGCAGLLCAATVVVCFGRLHWLIEAGNQLRPILGVVLLAMAAIAFRTGHRRPCWACAIFGIMNLTMVFSSWVSLEKPDRGPAAVLSLVHLNLDVHNTDPAAAVPFVRKMNPDILFLQEVTPASLRTVSGALPGFRIVLAHPLQNTHGSAFLVNRMCPGQVQNTRIVNLPKGNYRPLLATWVQVASKKIAILSLHTIRARNRSTALAQQVELEAVAEWSREQQKLGWEVLIAGDFNTTPWSSGYRSFLTRGGLKSAGSNLGEWPTWPGKIPIFPIDLAATSKAVATVAHKRGPYFGSDHRPVFYRWEWW